MSQKQSEEILVFKGFEVTYNSIIKAIICEDADCCYYIKDVPPDQVTGVNARKIVFTSEGRYFLLQGNELWSNGKKWIIKTNLDL